MNNFKITYMKTIKLIGALIVAIISCVIFSDCSSDPIVPEITVEMGNENYFTKNMDFDSSVGEKTFSFNSNVDWTIDVAATRNGTTWCTVTPNSGKAGANTVRIKVQENTGYDDRNVVLTLTAGSTLTKTITVTQKQKDALLLTTNKFEVEPQGGKINIEVKANVEYEVIVPETYKSWISQGSKSRGLTTSTVTFDIAETEEYDKREGEIIIQSGNMSETVHVYQTGQEILLLTKNKYPVSDKGETIAVEIKSNFTFDVQMPDVDWVVDESKSKGVSSHTLYYKILPNETYDSREAEIIFYDKTSSITDTLKIIQAQKDAIILSKKEYDIKSEGDILEIKLNTNVEFKYIIPDSCKWITRIESKSRGLEEHEIVFNIDKNENLYSRSTTIKFTSDEKSLVDSINIVQFGSMKDIYVKEAGTISNLISDKEKWTTKAIKISGLINGTDIRFILEMIGYSNDPTSCKEGVLTTLDLSDSRIVEGGDSYTTDQWFNPLYTKNDELGDYMFWYSNIQHIVLPKDIKVVGKYALGWCNELQSVKLFNNIEKLDDRAFCDSPKLQSIEVPYGVTYIGEQTFAGINISSIKIPNTVTHISNEAFCNSGIEYVEIPSSVEFMGNGIFTNCSFLKEFHGKYASKDNKCLIYNDTLICYAIGNNDSIYNIPTEAITIGKKAFAGSKNLTSIIIPNSVNRIQNEAFMNVPLSTIEIPNSIVYLEELALKDCNSLKAIYGKYSSLDNKCLIYNNTIMKYATAVTDETFNIPDGVKTIGKWAFYGGKFKTIKLPNTITNIKDYAFYNCRKLENIDISDNLLTIGDAAFMLCLNLTSINLPNKVTSIGRHAFLQCMKLETFKLPYSVKSIGEQTFSYCQNLKKLYCHSIEPPTIYPKYGTNYGYSLGIQDSCVIYVPKQSLDKYKYSDFAYGYIIEGM